MTDSPIVGYEKVEVFYRHLTTLAEMIAGDMDIA
jgi:hypothetical protein